MNINDDKWNELAGEINEVLTIADSIDSDARVYYLTHPEEDSNGNMKMKTAGKLVDNMVTPEGYFNTVIGVVIEDGKHWYKVDSTHRSENYKSPMGMFNTSLIPNDLEDFDTVLCNRLGIEKVIDSESLQKRIEKNDEFNKKKHDKRAIELANM